MKNEQEIIETIHAIQDKKNELADAKFIVEFYPTIINELETRLFNLIEGEDNNGVTGRLKRKETDKSSKRVLYR